MKNKARYPAGTINHSGSNGLYGARNVRETMSSFSGSVGKTDFSTSSELGLFYQQKIYTEKQRIAELDRQRQVTFTDLVQTPTPGFGEG